MQADVDAAVQQHAAALREVWRLVRKIKRDPDISSEQRHLLLTQLYSPLSGKDIRETFTDDREFYNIGRSFRASVTHLRQLKASLAGHNWRISPGGNPKMRDREFASELGVPVPRTLQRDVQLKQIELRPSTIVKPVSGAGSRGVMFVDQHLTIHSVKTGRIYESLGDAAGELPVKTRDSRDKTWIVEEAILDARGNPANDLKVYAFYGEPGMIVEISRNQGPGNETLYCTYSPDGYEIGLGPNVKAFRGSGLPADVLDKARTISLASPVPFLRIDFHYGADECYLGEITPHPGGTYAGDLYDEVDKDLGRRFSDAEARLYMDLIKGKAFPEYFAIYEAAPVGE